MNITKCHDCCYSHYNGRNLACERFSMDVTPKGFCHVGAEKTFKPSNIDKIAKLLDFYNEAESMIKRNEENEIH